MPYEIDIVILSLSLSPPHISLSSGKWNSKTLIIESVITQSCLSDSKATSLFFSI